MKNCMYCDHMVYYGGFGGSDVTPAEMPSFSCKKNHFHFKEPDRLDEYSELISKAKTCTDYKEVTG